MNLRNEYGGGVDALNVTPNQSAIGGSTCTESYRESARKFFKSYLH